MIDLDPIKADLEPWIVSTPAEMKWREHCRDLVAEVEQLRAIVNGGKWVSAGVLNAIAAERDQFKHRVEELSSHSVAADASDSDQAQR